MKRSKEKIILMTREETRRFLKTTFPTLRKWTLSGLLVSYHMGGKIFYKQHEVIAALKRVSP